LSITAITSANIAAQYALMYGTIPPVVLQDSVNVPYIYAPLAHKQLIKIANNAVGAAQQVNFLVEGKGKDEVISYNGIVIRFVPLVGFMIVSDPRYIKVLMDLMSDMSELNVGQVANGAMQRYIKNIQTLATWCTNQEYITLYGG